MGQIINNGGLITYGGYLLSESTESGWSGGDVIYNALTTSAKTSYTAATVGNFISVSVTDYNNVFSALSNGVKVGMSDSQFAEGGSSWAGGCAVVLPSGTSMVSSSSYIVGYACYSTSSSSNVITPLISTTFKGTYTGISNSITVSGSGYKYFIRKAPTNQLVSNSYVGHVSTTGFRMGTTTYTGGGHDCGSPYSSWTNWNSASPSFQMFGTNNKQW